VREYRTAHRAALPALPRRPTIEDVERRQRAIERYSQPQIALSGREEIRVGLPAVTSAADLTAVNSCADGAGAQRTCPIDCCAPA
jgi:hypothetical protein